MKKEKLYLNFDQFGRYPNYLQKIYWNESLALANFFTKCSIELLKLSLTLYGGWLMGIRKLEVIFLEFHPTGISLEKDLCHFNAKSFKY
ncbi:hypothetical protein Cycma_3791 [Cyclobacterium marinum DSM 745]|uniref:Uncharacterized protein n=1 Tax=Cyclobacterium marinum (strain ATCC 25205 / DSM 745 / LMG 13164 / NCIMB 1802) TaxID=880070 RepID=G0J477_CYCMS|nr:hypothetical protein Cycma_3791 [Cyclobacterium marinum DSM 745]